MPRRRMHRALPPTMDPKFPGLVEYRALSAEGGFVMISWEVTDPLDDPHLKLDRAGRAAGATAHPARLRHAAD